MDSILVGKIIFKERRKKKISRYKFAKLLDVDIKCINKWEKGICLPYYDKLEKICNILDIDIYYLTDNKYDFNDNKSLLCFYLLLVSSILLMLSYGRSYFIINVILTFVFGIISLFNSIKNLYSN